MHKKFVLAAPEYSWGTTFPLGGSDVSTVAADARIHNRDEVLVSATLDSPPDHVTGGELIFAAYDRWAEGCPERLIGDFAFAVWDTQRHALFCARDQFGIKPFYYYNSDQLFACASSLEVLLSVLDARIGVNTTRIGDYLSGVFDDTSSTFYKGISRLPPGHCMQVSREGVRVWRYWSLDPSRELRLRSDEEYEEVFQDLFTEAVRCRLHSTLPVGSTLSGGLDSSSISCVARNLLAFEGRQPLKTFSAVFDDLTSCDERPFINSVIAQGEIEPHFVRADQLSPLMDLERILAYQDEPFYAPNLYMHWALYRAAQEQGVQVLLDGIDGDTVVSHGMAYLPELARTGHWMTLARETRAFAQRRGRSPWGLLSRNIWHNGLKPLAPAPLRPLWRALRGGGRARPVLDPMINPDFAKRIGLRERLAESMAKHQVPSRSEREDHYRHLTHGIHSLIFEVAHRAASAFGIEPRYPFFDRRLVEFCLALPPEQKLSNGWTRMILRRSMEGILPREIQWRVGKTNLSPNFHRGLRGPDRPIVEDLLQRPGALGEYVDLRTLRETYRQYLAGVMPKNRLSVWTAVTLGLWLRHKGFG